jgi:catechol 2,3-dioxygenase-like lactoylglutathione lyase family enzyme
MDAVTKQADAPTMVALDHVQLAIPRGSEDRCRSFYVDLLGMTELTKPPVLAARGGMWLQSGPVIIHLGVEADFQPARKAHPAITVTDIDGLATRLGGSGYTPTWDNETIPGTRRFHVSDPLGNRMEFIAGNEGAHG